MAPLKFFSVISLTSLATTVTAAASGALLPRTHYAPRSISTAWKEVGDADPSAPLTFAFVLDGDYDGLTKRMETIAAQHSEWLGEEELAKYIAPSTKATTAVEAAIKQLGATEVGRTPSGDKITVTTTVENASKYFATEFKQYDYQGSTRYKTTSFTVPGDIAAYVSGVTAIGTFASPRSSIHIENEDAAPLPIANIANIGTNGQQAPASCSASNVTSACYRALYGYDTYQPKSASPDVAVGIVGFIGQSYNPDDLQTWLKIYRPDAVGYTIPVNVSDGAVNNPNTPGVETALDTQTMAGIVYPLKTGFYDIGDDRATGLADPFLSAFQNFINMKGRPSVVSISYGDDELNYTPAQADTMCKAAQQLSALGTTIVLSSGDDGVDGGRQYTCPIFRPTYPGGCPFILSVGATQNFAPEVMVDPSVAGFWSGSGFSNHFKAPKYQQAQTAYYVASLKGANAGNYNKTGRAFPDVSAQGFHQPVVASGKIVRVGGTSASAPIVAGGLTLLNNLLRQHHKPTLGWINPTLYSHPGAFTDVKGGGSFGCASPNDTTLGFPAKAGWDAAAGLGTPLFKNLRAVYRV